MLWAWGRSVHDHKMGAHILKQYAMEYGIADHLQLYLMGASPAEEY
jgi:hypothetical protein